MCERPAFPIFLFETGGQLLILLISADSLQFESTFMTPPMLSFQLAAPLASSLKTLQSKGLVKEVKIEMILRPLQSGITRLIWTANQLRFHG